MREIHRLKKTGLEVSTQMFGVNLDNKIMVSIIKVFLPNRKRILAIWLATEPKYSGEKAN